MSIKSTIAAVAASPFLLAGAAFAGPYVNVESNLSYPDGDYSSTATDIHLGYEGTAGAEGKIAYYVQGGPSLNHTEVGDNTETEISGVTAEASNEDVVNWGAKLGAKFVF